MSEKEQTFKEKAAELLLKSGARHRPLIKPIHEAQKDLIFDKSKMNELMEKFEENRKAVYRMALITLKHRKMNSQK